MNATKIVTALMALVVVSAGAGAVTAADIDAETTTIDANYDDGTVSVTVLQNDTGVENVSVTANDEAVGTTDANGSLTFETNATELEMEFTKNNTTLERSYVVENGTLVLEEEADTEDDEENETESQLDATAAYDNGTVDVTVTQNGSAVENVSVTANGEDVGMTDANGSLTFETNATEELELTFEKGNMTLVQEYTIEDGSLVLETDDDEEDAEGNVTLSANENASDRAHSVLAVIQQFLNSGGEGNLGQQIQDALGNDRGNSENAKENKGNGNADAAPGQSSGDDDDEADDENENEQKGNGNAPDHAGNGNGNAPDHAGNDDDEDDEDDESESDE